MAAPPDTRETPVRWVRCDAYVGSTVSLALRSVASATPSPSLLRRGWFLVRRFAAAHPGPLAASLVGTVLYASGLVAGAWAVGRVTDQVVLPAVRDGTAPMSTLLAGVGLVVGVALARSLGIVGRRYFGNMFSQANQRTLRTELAEHYLSAPLSFSRDWSTGELLSVLDNDVDRAAEAMGPLPISLGTVFLAVISLVSLFLVDPVIMVVAAVLIPATVVLNQVFASRMEGPAARWQDELAGIAQVAHESLDGVLTVKSLGLESAEVARFRARADSYRQARMDGHRVRAFFEPSMELIPTLASVAVVAVGAWRQSQGLVTTGQVVQAVTLFSLVAFPLRVLSFFLEQIPLAVVSLERIDAVLEDQRPALGPVSGGAPLPPGPLSVVAKGLSFRFGEELPLVLDDVGFELDAGEIVALVGATGSGKTTLCQLLAGLEPPNSGTVELGGIPLDEVDPVVRASQIAVVFQEPFLLRDSIAENLRFGAASVGDDLLAAALDTARAGRFVARLPQGIDTVLGERGVTLSGGQRQRLALARALVRRPGLLLLDDATSAVDPRVEAEILAGIRSLGAAGRTATVLIVAHRLSTIRLADRVVFLDAGTVAASGPHEALLELPAYAELARAYEQAEQQQTLVAAAEKDL